MQGFWLGYWVSSSSTLDRNLAPARMLSATYVFVEFDSFVGTDARNVAAPGR